MTDHLRVIESLRRAALPSCTRATAEGRRGASSNHRRLLFGARAGSRRPPFGETTRLVEPSAFGCAERRGGFSPRGRSTGIPPYLRGPCWDAAEMFSFGNASEPNATGLGPPFGAGREERRAPAFGLEATVTGEPSTFGSTVSIGRRSQTRPRVLAFLRLFGSGTPKRVWNREAKRPARKRLGGATARQHRNRVDPKPMGASSGAEPKGCVAATDSSVEQGPEVDGVESAAWRHASGFTSNGGRARQPVNAADSERGRRGDGMVEGCRGGERFVGYSPQGKILRTFGSTTSGSTVRPQGRTRESETW